MTGVETRTDRGVTYVNARRGPGEPVWVAIPAGHTPYPLRAAAPPPAGSPGGVRTVRARRANPPIDGGAYRPTGPGAELKLLLESVGFRLHYRCGCDEIAAQMDRWGAAGCREPANRAFILRHLEEQRAKASWWDRRLAELLAVTTGLAFRLNPRDPLGSLLDEAVRLAELRGPRVPSGPGDGARHLLYYLWPCRGNGVWQMNLDRLKERAALFDGRRAVAVATSVGAEDPAAVRDYLGPGFDVFTLPNDDRLREVAAWEPLWERVLDRQGPDDVCFFAHGKGVTKPVNPGVTVHEWADVMYRANLDYWPVVEEQLARYPIAGTFKKVGRGFGIASVSDWHYSGTFYWVRLADFFSRNWRGVDRIWWGTESYPGVAYAQHEGGVTFGRGIVPTLNLYVRGTWDWVRPEWEAWQREHAGQKGVIPSGIGSPI